MAHETAALDESKLTPASSAFLNALRGRLPGLVEHALMERIPGVDGWHVLVEACSPSGDLERGLLLWMNHGEEVSVNFGAWHTHAGWWSAHDAPLDEEAAMIHLIQGILADRFVLLHDAGDQHRESSSLIDLERPDELIDVLTSAGSSGRGRILTWTGRGDRDVGLQDLDAS